MSMTMSGAEALYDDSYTVDPQYIYGVPDPPSPPAGSDSLPPPAQPVVTPTPAGAMAAGVASAVQAGTALSAGSVWRMPAFQAVLLGAVGVVIIAHASWVSGKAG